MPELSDLLDAAARELSPASPPDFADVLRRARRRRTRRTAGTTLLLLALGAAGLGGVLAGPAPDRTAAGPVGLSRPSPYPGAGEEGTDDVCQAPDAVDASGRLTRRVTLGQGSAVLEPAGGRASRSTAEQALARYRSEHPYAAQGQHPRAVFGLLTDPTGSPFPKRLPVWLVVSCDAPETVSHGGVRPGPTPAPGTPPSPGGRTLGEDFLPYDETGHALYEEQTGYPDQALRSELLVEVPFARSASDSADGRQVAITYRTDDSCAAFDHLDVQEPDATQDVHVRVWLHLLPGVRHCPGTRDRHGAVVGLRYPLGGRALVRGGTGP